MELEKRYGVGVQYSNSLQTNGISLNKDWATFLKEHNWLLGISLDGPEFIHDNLRLNKGGKGRHKKVEENAKMLLREEVEVNILCCVTNESAKYPELLYKYF